jgi:hypothetical protein
MDASRSQAWVHTALLIGVLYFVVGRAFALSATHVQGWRLAAWIVSGVLYASHIAYENVRLRNPPGATAWHVAAGVAIGALGLAVAGMLHSFSTTSGIRPAWFLALVLWPAITAVPAFVGALVAGMLLRRLTWKVDVQLGRGGCDTLIRRVPPSSSRRRRLRARRGILR